MIVETEGKWIIKFIEFVLQFNFFMDYKKDEFMEISFSSLVAEMGNREIFTV